MSVGVAGQAVAFMIDDMDIRKIVQWAHVFVRCHLTELLPQPFLRLGRQSLVQEKQGVVVPERTADFFQYIT